MHWKQRKGPDATYNNLIRVFEEAGYRECAEVVRIQVCKPNYYRTVGKYLRKCLTTLQKIVRSLSFSWFHFGKCDHTQH